VVLSELIYKFEELALYTIGKRHVAGLVDGEALLLYDPDYGDDLREAASMYSVERIWLEVAYLPKLGEIGRVDWVELSRDAPGPAPSFPNLFQVVSFALATQTHFDHITEQILRANDNAGGAQ
jgi:hypothetical protein